MTDNAINHIIYHDHQLDGDRAQNTQRHTKDVLQKVIDAYRSGMSIKGASGLGERLRNAEDYLSSDRVDKVVFHATKNEKTDKKGKKQDCEDCEKGFTVNFDLLRLQHETAVAIMYDALKSRGDDYASIEATPVPDASEVSSAIIAENAYNSVMREMFQNIPAQDDEEAIVFAIPLMEELAGTEAGLERLEEAAVRQRQIQTSKLTASARKKAVNAERHVDDKIVESNYDQELREFQGRMLWSDYAVMFAPFKTEEETTELNQKGELRESVKEVWQMDNVNPLNHFFSDATSYTDMGDFEGDILYMSKNDLMQLRQDGGYEDVIDEVLDSFSTMLGSVNVVQQRYHNPASELNDTMPVIRIFIKLPTDDVKALFPDNKINDKKSSHVVEMLCTENAILYAQLYPRWKSFPPYRKMSFNMPDMSNLAAGRGLYSLCRTAQEMIDNALIGLFLNMRDINKYILEVNGEKIVNPEDLWDTLDSERPLVETKGVGGYATYGGNDRAIHLIQVPDNITAFTRALSEGIAIMERVGLSAFSLGQGNFPNVRSAGQSAIIQANGNRRFAKLLKDQEDLVETPIIDYIWTAECIETKDTTITVDGTIRATSYSSFLERQDKADQVGLFMQNIVGLMNSRATVPENVHPFLDSLIRDYASQHGYDAGELGLGADAGEIGELIQGADLVAQPMAGLDGRNNIPQDAMQVI